MSIGIGGAGSKLASLLDNGEAIIVNISEVELDKVAAQEKIRAVIHSYKDQFKGARKEPQIGREAYHSISDKLLEIIRGNIVFSSTGGGTGNGICSQILERLSGNETIPLANKTMFVFVLPYPELEASEYVDNTLIFLQGPVSAAIDTGNTGNMVLFSNRVKFTERLAEKTYNEMVIDSLRQFLIIPDKNAKLANLDGNIDHEDFSLYKSKPYFNHFCQFVFDPNKSFGTQYQNHHNPLLLAPEGAIEALFLLELPDPELTSKFYDIIDFFATDGVSPIYSVIHNPQIKKPLITVSVLYSRKPLELVDDFNQISGHHKRTRVKKAVDQYVTLPKLEVDLGMEARDVAASHGNSGDDILRVLKRIGKL